MKGLAAGAVAVACAAASLWAGPAAAQAQASVEGLASLTVMDPISLSETTAQAAAPLRRPDAGSAMGSLPGSTYTLRGLGGETYSVATPRSITVTRQGGVDTLQVQLHASQSAAALPGSAGAPAATSIAITATMPLTSASAAGTYVGRYGMTVTYP